MYFFLFLFSLCDSYSLYHRSCPQSSRGDAHVRCSNARSRADLMHYWLCSIHCASACRPSTRWSLPRVKPRACQALKQTTSVLKTNALSERDFAQLDRLLRQNPAADTLALYLSLSLDGMIAFANNRTAEWLTAKSEEQRSEIIASVRKAALAMQLLYKERQQEILAQRFASIKKRRRRSRGSCKCNMRERSASRRKLSNMACGHLWRK
eukprot:scpid84582/ scgid16564/ 